MLGPLHAEKTKSQLCKMHLPPSKALVIRLTITISLDNEPMKTGVPARQCKALDKALDDISGRHLELSPRGQAPATNFNLASQVDGRPASSNSTGSRGAASHTQDNHQLSLAKEGIHEVDERRRQAGRLEFRNERLDLRFGRS